MTDTYIWPIFSCPKCHAFPRLLAEIKPNPAPYYRRGLGVVRFWYRAERLKCPNCGYTFDAVIVNHVQHIQKRSY